MTTLVRFFKPDDELVAIEYENIIIPPIGAKVYISNTQYVVISLIYDYENANREENSYVMIDVNLGNVQYIDCSEFSTEE